MSKNLMCALLFLVMGMNVIIAQNQKIFITRNTKDDNSVEFGYLKKVPGNYFIEFELEKIENVADISAFQKAYNIDMNSESGVLFTLHPINPQKDILCSYAYSYNKGFIRPAVDSTVVYVLPFKQNKKINVKEGSRFNIPAEIWKNYIVYSSTKDTVFAMRKGVVSEIKKVTTKDKKNTILRTEIIVDHADGTFASYIGLDDNLLSVKLNETVYPGKMLGMVDDNFDNDQTRSFKFNIYFYSNEEIQDLEGKKIKIIERSVVPKFLTANGIQKLQNNSDYIVKYSNDILSQEMNEQEKQKSKIIF